MTKPSSRIQRFKTCPEDQVLVAFYAGELTDEEVETLGDHLGECTRCLDSLASFKWKDDPILSEVRDLMVYEDEEESRCAQVCERAQQWSVDVNEALLAELTDGEEPDDNDCKALPDKFADYRLSELIGRGATGVVYRGWHSRLKRKVVIKILAHGVLSDTRLVERFEREMEAVGKLDHPNIIRATDASSIGGYHYLVMEYV